MKKLLKMSYKNSMTKKQMTVVLGGATKEILCTCCRGPETTVAVSYAIAQK